MGPILNTVLGAGIKIGANILSSWMEQRRQDQLALAARDDKMMQSLIESQKANASDPFVKVTRRILFMSITFTLCYLMLYYAHNPSVSYDMLVPKGSNSRWGIFSWFVGGDDFTVVRLTGGLMLSSFMDLCFMVVGFYAIPSKRT